MLLAHVIPLWLCVKGFSHSFCPQNAIVPENVTLQKKVLSPWLIIRRQYESIKRLSEEVNKGVEAFVTSAMIDMILSFAMYTDSTLLGAEEKDVFYWTKAIHVVSYGVWLTGFTLISADIPHQVFFLLVNFCYWRAH